ncbi:MAG: hypothetical protein ACRDLB_02270 [Actinomycetota bacterium]
MKLPLRPLTLALASVLMLAVVPHDTTAGAVSRKGGSAGGTLRGETVIRWSGIKGMVLKNKREFVWLSRAHMDLEVDGTIAYVAISPVRQPRSEDCYFGTPDCEKFQLLWVRDFDRHVGNNYEQGWQIHDPPRLAARGGPIELYLMTDGEATLTLKPRGMRGRATYVAGGRIIGAVAELPATCPTIGCDPQSGYGERRYRVGGKTVDLGRLGFSSVVAYSVTADDEVVQNQSQQVRACHYPNPADKGASPKAADHPWGCDPLGQPLTDPDAVRVSALQTFNQVYTGLGPASGVKVWEWLPGGKGRKYLGYHVGWAGPSDAKTGAYGIWYRYGIHPPR